MPATIPLTIPLATPATAAQPLDGTSEGTWVDVCALRAITPDTGVGALIAGRQIALVRVGHRDDVYAVGNFDPFSKAFVIARGIVGDAKGIPKIASPIYKQSFNLITGECLDDGTVRLPIYPVRVVDGRVLVLSPVP